MPEHHRVGTIHPLQVRGTLDSQPLFDGLETPAIAQTHEHRSQVDMYPWGIEIAEATMDAGQVETSAVEGDHQLKVQNGVFKLFQVDSLDECPVMSAIIEAYDGNVRPVIGSTRRLNVQESALVSEIAIQPPAFGDFHSLGKETCIVFPCQRRFQNTLNLLAPWGSTYQPR